MDSTTEWEQFSNIDMCRQGDVEIIGDWKKTHTIEQLKLMVQEKGYTCFTVSAGEPSFGHAALKKFDWQVTKDTCKPITTCCNHPCTIYILKRPDMPEWPELLKTPSHGNPPSTNALNTELNNVARNTNDTERALWLIEKGADLKSTCGDHWNCTPLHQACYHGRFKMAETLMNSQIEKDISLELPSNSCLNRGERGTPFELAEGGDHLKIADLLMTKIDPSWKRPPYVPPPNQEPEESDWERFANIDMCGMGDVEIICDWSDKFTIEQLKQKIVDKGCSALAVDPTGKFFKHAAIKYFEYQLTRECCKPAKGYQLDLYIYKDQAKPLMPIYSDGVWAAFDDMDMCGKGDVESIDKWNENYSLDELKQYCQARGYVAISMGRGDPPSFEHACAKAFPYTLKKEHLKPSEGYKNTLLLFTPAGEPKSFPGTWETHDNMDLFGHYETAERNSDNHTLEELQWMCVQEGFSTLTILNDKPKAYLRKVDTQVRKEDCTPISGPFQHPCKVHIFTRAPKE